MTAAADCTPPTTPPPAMPRMSARDDGPRYVVYAGPDSRYYRLRREAAARAENVTLVDIGAEREPECDDCEDTGRRDVDEGTTLCWCSAGDVAEDDFSERNGYPRLRGTKRGAK